MYVCICYNPYVPWKDKEKQREAIRKHYRENREKYIEKAQNKRRQLRAWVYSLKENTPCADCHKYFPYYVMDFDHIENKMTIVSKVINSGSWTKTKAEIAKCEIVCANCHRMRTYRRLQEASPSSSVE